jgi:hypothetical protein
VNKVRQFNSFSEFYPFYLQQHSDPVCRLLHYIGSTLVLLSFAWIVVVQAWMWLWLLPVFGYGCAWIGHFYFEHNRPATFTYPWYSLMGDWVMYFQFLTGRLPTKSDD